MDRPDLLPAQRTRGPLPSFARACTVLLIVLALSACSRSEPTPTASETTAPPRREVDAPRAPSSLPEVSFAEYEGPGEERPGELVEELWYAFYHGGRKFGYSHLAVRRIERNGRTLLETVSHQQSVLPRGNDTVTQLVQLTTRATPEGRVLEVESSIEDGGTPIHTHGISDDKTLTLTVTTAGNQVRNTIPWSPEYGGLHAEHATMRQQPMQPGESRRVRAFMPLLNSVYDLELQAEDYEDVEMPLGHESLLRIRVRSIITPEAQIESVLWTDAEGTIRKFWVQPGDITAVQTVREVARAPDERIDLFEATQVRVADAIPDPHQKRRAVYRVRLRSGEDPQPLFATGTSQRVRSIDASTIELEVRAVRPDEPPELESQASPPEPADLAANALIEHEDPAIRQLADQVAPSAEGDWQWAVACEKFVHGTINRKVLSHAFRTAAEVARQREGDCTEHAVLLAALCRAHGLPARVATGLVAYGDVYAFHMWNGVWIADRWIPLDATLARGGIGAGHVKLSHSNLAGVSPFTALMPVLEIMGQLELEIVEYE